MALLRGAFLPGLLDAEHVVVTDRRLVPPAALVAPAKPLLVFDRFASSLVHGWAAVRPFLTGVWLNPRVKVLGVAVEVAEAVGLSSRLELDLR